MLNNIYGDIAESNRKSAIAYSIISVVAFGAMTLFALLDQNAVSKNWLSYILGTVVMIVLLVLNLTVAKKYRRITHVTAYLFVFVLLAVGILLAVSSKNDVTASFMVFLFVAPLLFTLRPLYVIIIVIGTDLFYMFYMHMIQAPELFQKNIVNAVIYGLLSVFVSTIMIRMRIQKFETDYRNRILTETDQLTGMLNRRSFEQHMERLAEDGSVTGMKMCVFDVNGLKQTNDNIGHHAGDELLRATAVCLEKAFGRYGLCYRIGGDEFVAILTDTSPEKDELADLLNRQVVAYRGEYISNLSIATGIEVGTQDDTPLSLFQRADARMYESKAAYYQRLGIDRRKRM